MATAGFSRDDQLRLLQQQYGVDAKRAAALLGARETMQAPTEVSAVARAVMPLPLRFTLPWTALVSENRRFCAHGNCIFMTAEYKAARAKIREIVRGFTTDAAPLEIPLSLTAGVYMPDNRIHDAPNFAGGVHNALKKLVYVDDQWLYRAIWERAGVDPDRPRADIEIRLFVA